jgi:hypothetical protein
MKKIITSNVVDPSKLQPFTAQSLRFLQEAKEEDVAGLIKALVISNLGSYSLGTPYVISGCVVSDSGKDVTAGEIFYGGKYYETTAVNGTTNIARFILTPSQDATADPLTFSDSSVFNVHTIYKYVATDVASGGDFTSANLVDIYAGSTNKFTYYNEILTYRDETSGTPIVGPYPSTGLNSVIFTFTTPNDGKTRDVLITLTSNIDANTGVSFGYNTIIKKATVSVSTNSIQKGIGQSESFVHNYLATSVAPNTVFSIEDFRTGGTSGAVNRSSLSVISLF